MSARLRTRSALAFGLGLTLLIALALGLAPQESYAQHAHSKAESHDLHAKVEEAPREEPWPKAVVQSFSKLAIQDLGRIKPISVYAGFRLLKLNGKRSLKIKTPGGKEQTLKPVPWLLDTLFFPKQAMTYTCFRVQDSRVLGFMGLEGKKKRDWYSYNELIAGAEKLGKLRQQLAGKDNKDLEPDERQALELYRNLSEYSQLLRFMDFARGHLHALHAPALKSIFPADAGPAQLLSPESFTKLSVALNDASLPKDKRQALTKSVGQLMNELQQRSRPPSGGALTILPNFNKKTEDPKTKAWLSPGQVISLRVHAPKLEIGNLLGAVQRLEAMERVAGRGLEDRERAVEL